MARSVVNNQTERCPRCRMPPRWCVCEGLRELDCSLRVDVLIHDKETMRPTSTGNLIKRVIPSAGLHFYRVDHELDRGQIEVPGRELWILHPNGEEMPTNRKPEEVQVLLLDGTWLQAKGMMKALCGWGRKVRLPMTGSSRYWLRAQQGEGQFSTAEALLFLMQALGMSETHAQFKLQFELQVYAGLCLRGDKARAAEFLSTSPLAAAMPGLVAKLNHSRRDNP